MFPGGESFITDLLSIHIEGLTKAIQRNISSVSVIASLLLISQSCISQTTKDNIEGAWKGTSICQVKNSPCHDESVVCYITKSSKPDVYAIQMNKIVNDAEEEMGALDFSYDKSKQTLTATTKDQQQRECFWKFIIKDNQITAHSCSRETYYTGRSKFKRNSFE